MDKPSILIIEDDKAVKNLIVTALEMYGYHHIWADKGEQGILSTASRRPGIILLDLGLPDMDGVDVALKTRPWTDTPIIIISARGGDDGRITALDTGAGGYLTKPFPVDELLARLRSTQRRLNYMQSLEEVQISLFANGELTINYVVGCACLDEEELHLTPYEYELLYPLAHSVGKALTHSYITRKVWGAAWEGDVASPRVLMASLREKIEENPSQPQYVQTHVGVGYWMMKR